MRILSTRMGYVVATAIAVPVVAMTMLIGGQQASAATCPQIGDKLASQNREVARLMNRAPLCMKKHATSTESLKRYSESSWTSKCEAGKKSSYNAVASNRDRILRKCIPRGSDD